MDDRTCKDVPYIVHESAEARHERRERRLLIAVIIAVVLMFASNAMWLYMWAQYDYESYSVEYAQDGRGLNIIGDRNGVDYGPAIESHAETPD